MRFTLPNIALAQSSCWATVFAGLACIQLKAVDAAFCKLDSCLIAKLIIGDITVATASSSLCLLLLRLPTRYRWPRGCMVIAFISTVVGAAPPEV